MITKATITQEELKRVLDYDESTGVFSWKINRWPAEIGRIAGCIRLGYRIIGVNGKKYNASRLAYLYIHGFLPEHFIDHINRNRGDDRICNLREVTMQCNVINSGNRKDNTSGIKGVYWAKNRNKWMAYLKINGKMKFIGLYKDFDNAVAARLAAEQCFGWGSCDNMTPAYKHIKNVINTAKNPAARNDAL